MSKVSTKKTKQKKKTIREEIKELLREIDEKRYDLYLKVYQVRKEELFINWGFSKFKEWVEEDLGIPYRVGLWYAQIGEFVVRFDIPRQVVVEISWTKLKEIAKLESLEDIKELLKKAPSMSFRELEAEVKQRREKIGGREEKNTTLTLKLKNDQYDVVMSAIERAKGEIQTDSISSALEYICQEFLVNRQELENELFSEE